MSDDPFMAERRRKAEALAALGLPVYNVDFRPDHTLEEDLAIEQAPAMAHAASRRGSALARAWDGHFEVVNARHLEEPSMRELLDDRPERHGREERQRADDQDHADEQADEDRLVGAKRAG